MKIVAQMCAFREAPRIIPAIKQFEGLIDKVIVTCSTIPWKGDLKPDNTAELARTTFADVYEGDWKTEAEQRNFMMEKSEEFDWVLIAPPDRFFTKETLRNLRLFLGEAENRHYSMHTIDYWKNTNTVIYPLRSLNLAVFPPFDRYGRPFRFTYANTSDQSGPDNPLIPGTTAHHISWIKTNEEVLTKIKSYTHADEIIPTWYQEKWIDWKYNTSDFAPVTPHDYKKATDYQIPEEIRDLLKKYEHNI